MNKPPNFDGPGTQRVTSLENFKSPQAIELLKRFGLTLEEIPGLRRKFDEKVKGLEILVGSSGEEAARAIAAEAAVLYEAAMRGASIRLVIPNGDITEQFYGLCRIVEGESGKRAALVLATAYNERIRNYRGL